MTWARSVKRPIGKRRHRCDFYRNQLQVDAHGHEKVGNDNWSLVSRSVPCELQSKKGIDGEVSHELYMEYHSGRLATTGMRAVINTVAFEVLSVDDTDNERRELVLMLRRITSRDDVDYVAKIDTTVLTSGGSYDLPEAIDEDATHTISIKIQNKSSLPLSLANISVSGTGFSLNSTTNAPLALDEVYTIVLLMDTATTGAKSATLSFSANGLDEFPFTQTIYGVVE